MALIEYKIDRDINGNITIASTVLRIDPGDEIRLITTTPEAALEFSIDSPFSAPAAEKVYILPRADSASSTLKVTRSIDLLKGVAQCGGADSAGNFTAWGGSSGGFPGTGGTN